jgi:hypothetical protein
MTVIALLVVAALLVGLSPGLTLVAAAAAGLLLERFAPGWRRQLQ